MWVKWSSTLSVGLALLVSCSERSSPSRTGPQVGRDTHFLGACGGEADCLDSTLSCVCGVCTRACLDDEACRDQSTDAVCVDASRTATAMCEAPASAVCAARCQGDEACGDGLVCADGVCAAGPVEAADAPPEPPDLRLCLRAIRPGGGIEYDRCTDTEPSLSYSSGNFVGPQRTEMGLRGDPGYTLCMAMVVDPDQPPLVERCTDPTTDAVERMLTGLTIEEVTGATEVRMTIDPPDCRVCALVREENSEVVVGRPCEIFARRYFDDARDFFFTLDCP